MIFKALIFGYQLNGTETMNFNRNFYKPNTSATIEQAQFVLESKGIAGAIFKSMSRSNGVSFYFDFNGTEVRVSDHRKTSFYNGIQFDLYKVGVFGMNKKLK